MTNAELRALAEAATPGPWDASQCGDYGDYEGNSRVILGDDLSVRVTVCQHHGRAEDDANAEFIAAANPTRVLALLDAADRVAGLEAQFERAMNTLRLQETMWARDRAKLDAARLEDWRAGVEAAADEVDTWVRVANSHQGANRIRALTPPATWQAGDGWRPIETAPRDGTAVLTWLPDRRIRIDSQRVGKFAGKSRDGMPTTGYMFAGSPTHWRPLPAPPPPAATEAPGDGR